MFEIFFSPLIILLSLCTGTGVLLHETKADKVASMTLFRSVYAHSTGEGALETTPHTHVEQTSVNSSARELSARSPGLTPRRDDKKFHLQKRVVKGFHPFDAYYLPSANL